MAELVAARAIGAVRPPGRLSPAFFVSLLVHVLLLAALLMARRPNEAPQWLPPPSFDMVFEGGGQPSVAAPGPTAPSPGTAGSLPAPAASALSPGVAESPAPPTSPARGRGESSSATSAPTQAPAAPTTFLPPRAERGIAPSFTSPAQRERSPRSSAAGEGRFPAPMTFSLGIPAVPRSRGLDLYFGSGVGGGDETRVMGISVGKGVGPDWANRFAAWWVRHRYYPPEAGENGQQGDVVVDFTVRSDGFVQGLLLSARSGSPFLDLATLAILRDAHLPPLPAAAGPAAPVRLTVRYRIVH